jgi:SAM-dependent methyltransferase
LEVKRGPFAGMRYPRSAIARVGFLPAKLLGSYEHEIHRVFEDAARYELFVDIGSGDGYYCVGMARRHPEMRVIGYEIDGSERSICMELAAVNAVEVDARGTATHEELNGLPPGRLMVLCDVEGFEDRLLDPTAVPRLRECGIVVEVHPWVRDGLLEDLTQRFSQTHHVEVINGVRRRPGDYVEIANWPRDLGDLAVTEGRPHAPIWLVLRERS